MAIRWITGSLALVSGGGFILASYYTQMPVRSEVLAWVAFLLNAAVIATFVHTERMPVGKYTETKTATEIFNGMNETLRRVKRDHIRLHAAMGFVLRSLHPGDVVGTAFIRELDGMLKKTENGKG